MARKITPTTGRRSELTFEQAEGVEPLPRQLQPKELSQHLRVLRWRVVATSLGQEVKNLPPAYRLGPVISDRWEAILRDRQETRQQTFDNFVVTFPVHYNELQQMFRAAGYVEILGFLEFVIRHRKCPPGFSRAVDDALERGRSAYRVIQKSIIALGSEAELDAVKRSFQDFAPTEFGGARTHLKKRWRRHLTDALQTRFGRAFTLWNRPPARSRRVDRSPAHWRSLKSPQSFTLL
jgi:hypothetical protein